MRGDIETPWATRAKEYAWSLCVRLAPRNISPMDVDYIAECNSRFAVFEMKTQGATMKRGQRLALANLMKVLGDCAVLFIVEHPPLDKVVMPNDVVRFRLVITDEGGKLLASEYQDGSRFAEIYSEFFKWADGGSFLPLRDLVSQRIPQTLVLQEAPSAPAHMPPAAKSFDAVTLIEVPF